MKCRNRWIKSSYNVHGKELAFFPSKKEQEQKIQKIYKMIFQDWDFLDYIDYRKKVCTRKGDLENFKYWAIVHQNFHHNGDREDKYPICCPICRNNVDEENRITVTPQELEKSIREQYYDTTETIIRGNIVDIHTVGWSVETIVANALR